MRLIKQNTLLCILFPCFAFAENIISTKQVSIYQTDLPTLSIHNLSPEEVTLDLSGQTVSIPSSSGVKLDCLGYNNLGLQFQNETQDYMDVECSSRIIINESFRNNAE